MMTDVPSPFRVWVFVGLSQRTARFDFKPIHMEFILGQIFLTQYFGFPCQNHSTNAPQFTDLFIHLPPTQFRPTDSHLAVSALTSVRPQSARINGHYMLQEQQLAGRWKAKTERVQRYSGDGNKINSAGSGMHQMLRSADTRVALLQLLVVL
jgi:hypothetical protein